MISNPSNYCKMPQVDAIFGALLIYIKERTMRRLIPLITICLITVPAFAESTLSHEKLIGKWCFTHVDVGGKRNEENIPYEFFENKEFSFKNSSSASTTRKAKYTFISNTLDISRLAPGGLKVIELTDTTMVAEGSFASKRYFKRGECGESK